MSPLRSDISGSYSMSDSIGSFSELNLSAPLLQALADVGYETPSPIQQACIPPLLEGLDLLGEAQTGTGKTAAFALPLLQRLDLKRLEPQILVLTPTRELAIQVAEAFQKYAKHLPGFHVLPIYGGQSMTLQLKQLRRGVHVIVGTPGRVMDHLERKSLSLDSLQALVLDEADEMLRMGFIDDVEWILEHTPAERQTALFSATMAEQIRRVARTHMREPREVKIKASTAHRGGDPPALLAGERHRQDRRADAHPRGRGRPRRRAGVRAHQDRHRRDSPNGWKRAAMRPRRSTAT